jgi:RHS repeat-associated protein
VSDGTGTTYTYDGRNRLSAASPGGTVYYVDGQGRRVAKTSSGFTASFAYDEHGHMLGKYGVSGGTITPSYETIYMGETPVAAIIGGKTYRIYADHLNAPRALADNTTTTVVWRWDGDPFGAQQPNEDADGDGHTVSFGLRYPGQYYDAETGLMQNGYRDYSPILGRYIESDPIGLNGGINTYGYVGSNPVRWMDSKGLCIEDACIGEAILIGELFMLAADEITAFESAEAALAAGEDAGAFEPYLGSKLAKNMAEAGRAVQKGVEQCHHIVARLDVRAQEARDALAQLGIDINNEANGVGLPAWFHQTMHTDNYYNELTELTEEWNSFEDAIDKLRSFGQELIRRAGWGK